MYNEKETNYDSDYYESIYRIIEDPFDCKDVYECLYKIEEQIVVMVERDDIRDYKISTEIVDALGKNGEPAYYVTIAWVDRDNVLDVCSGKLLFNAQ